MAIGMTYDEYWDGEYGTKRAARKAYEIRVRNEQILADRQNWLMMQYIRAVFAATPLLVGGLNVKSGTNLPELPQKPFLEQAEEQKKEEVRKQKEEDQMKLATALMQQTFLRFNKRFEKDQAKKTCVETSGQ